MRIFIENSGYQLLNMGDLAMLEVAISRISTLYPDVSIKILTTNPSKLLELFPNAEPVSVESRKIWFSSLLKKYYKRIPIRNAAPLGLAFENWLRQKSPRIFCYLLFIKLYKKRDIIAQTKKFINALYESDLVVATGGGYITDSFKQDTLPRLATLELAIQLGKPVVLLGQGIGPVQDQVLLKQMANVLPKANLISLREKRAGIPILSSLGVPNERICITGDDAIELAFNSRCKNLGNGLGINLRSAPYSEVQEKNLEIIRLTLLRLANDLLAPLIPIPIEHASYRGVVESDSAVIKKLLVGYSHITSEEEKLNTPAEIIKQVSRCRIVITGSYHAGVFALSQGIPIIGLAKSEYYIDKFLGLADQFKVGCSVILLNDENVENQLYEKVNDLWRNAENLRETILCAAHSQILKGQESYQKIYKVMSDK